MCCECLEDAVQRFARENNIKKFEKRNALEHLQAIAPDEVIPIPEGKTKEASETVGGLDVFERGCHGLQLLRSWLTPSLRTCLLLTCRR